MTVRMKIGLFLGAGASNIFGYPTTLTIMENLKTEQEIAKLIPSYIYKKLGQNRASEIQDILVSFFSDKSFHTNTDLEHLLHTVYKLEKLPSEFETQFLFNKSIFFTKSVNIGEFIQSYVPMIKDIIHNLVFESYRWKEKKVEFLVVYAKLFEKLLPVNGDTLPVFTTNYDSIIEQLCEQNESFYLIDGFKRIKNSFVWNNGDFENLVDSNYKNILLLKLHGSLTWHKKGSLIIRTLDKEDLSVGGSNILIYPTLHPKDVDITEPYSIVLNKFKEVLQGVINTLIVIGYSFRDSHINKIISHFFENKNNLLVLISPTAKSDLEREGIVLELNQNIKLIEQKVSFNNIDDIISQIETLINETH